MRDAAVEIRVLDHTADTGIEVKGGTLAAVIGGAVRGMFSLMAELPEPDPAAGTVTVEVQSTDAAELVVDVLSELLARSEIEGAGFVVGGVETHDERRAVLDLTPVSLTAIEPTGPPIKAVTYHDLHVTRTAAGWCARVIFDV